MRTYETGERFRKCIINEKERVWVKKYTQAILCTKIIQLLIECEEEDRRNL